VLSAGKGSMNVRNVVLVVFVTVWAFVVGLSAWRTSNVPAELWAVLGLGLGAVLTVFAKADGAARRGDDDDEGHRP